MSDNLGSVIQKQVFVHGKVQSVFYRDSTREYAQGLGLAGMVRNRSDGCVEVYVQGESQPVETLLKWLKIGPKLAKVTTIEVVDSVSSEFSSIDAEKFAIWPTR